AADRHRVAEIYRVRGGEFGVLDQGVDGERIVGTHVRDLNHQVLVTATALHRQTGGQTPPRGVEHLQPAESPDRRTVAAAQGQRTPGRIGGGVYAAPQLDIDD